MEDRYLGDGVYASFNGYYVILDLRGQDSTTRIALEPEVREKLDLYCADANAWAMKERRRMESNAE